MDTDVVIVGGSIAGCTTATLLARQGVACTVLERAPDPAHYKVMCAHFLQAGASPILRRLGLEEHLLRAGAVVNPVHGWTRYGWMDLTDADVHGWSIQRKKLDPMLRDLARDTDGVEIRQGVRVTGILADAAGRPCGVEGVHKDGSRVQVRARVVVGADGRGSDTARLARVRGRVLPNRRIAFMAYYEDLAPATGRDSLVWFGDPESAYAFPNDDGLTIMAAFTAAERAAEFKADREAAFLRSFDGLPRRPDLEAGRRVSPIIGKLDMPNVRRRTAQPGLAFVGDAAQASDPLWGVGCGFALQSAELLSDALGPALAGTGDVDAGLDRYRRAHRSLLAGHHLMTSDYSSGRRFNPLERLIYAAAPHHAPTRQLMVEMGARDQPLHRIMLPHRVARTAAAAARHRLAA